MRSYNRFKTDQKIECKIGRKRGTVNLYNLSSGGCMIETKSRLAKEGETIEVMLADNVSIPGKIVWRIDNNAGIKFDVPLHKTVVEKFGYDESEEFDRDDPRDRFGIPLVEYSSSAGLIEL